MREIWVLDSFPISFDILEIYHQLLKIYDKPLEILSEALFSCLARHDVVELESIICYEFFEDLVLLGDGSEFDKKQIARGFQAILTHIQDGLSKKQIVLTECRLITVHLAEPSTITLVFVKEEA